MDTAIGTDATGASDDGMALLRLLQLASPALPIGAFAYSQGLEAAVTAGLVTDEPSAAGWIVGLLRGPLVSVDLAVFLRLNAAFAAGDQPLARRWNDFLLASRATAELQAEERHLGAALARVLATLEILAPARAAGSEDASDADGQGTRATFAGMFARATAHWRIAARPAAEAFAFTWAEAQTSAAVRLVPLGQSAGVRILAAAGRAIPAAVTAALQLGDDDLGAAAPLQAVLSAIHETQYSRLFRS